MTFPAIALAGTLLTSMGVATAETPSLSVRVQAVPETRATVDIEIRNSSEDAIDGLIHTTLWLIPASNASGETCTGSVLSTSFDLDTATSYQLRQPDAPSSRLRLPVEGSRSVQVDPEGLEWSLGAPLDTGTLYELWEVAECAEYDFTVSADLLPMPADLPKPNPPWADMAESRPLRVHVGPE